MRQLSSRNKRRVAKTLTQLRRSPWRAFRPWLERLEDRTLPSTVNWINPAGGDWDTASNWQDAQGVNRLPGANDDVVINQTGITVTHAANVSESINSLTSQANIDWQNGSLTLTSNSSVSGQFSNEGSVVLQSGSLNLSGGGTSSGPITAAAGTNLYLSGFNVTGPLSGDAISLANSTIAGSFQANSTFIADFGGTVSFTGTVLGVGALSQGRSTADFSPALGGSVTLTVPSLISIGVLKGTDNFVVTGLTTLSDAAIEGQGGTFDAKGGLRIIEAAELVSINLINEGNAFWDVNQWDRSGIATLGPVTFTNLGTFTVQGNHVGAGSGDTEGFEPANGSQPLPTFDNQGSIVKVSPGNRLSFVAHFLNSGSIGVPGGILFVSDPAGDGTSSGPITAAAGTDLTVTGFTVTGALTGDAITLGNDTIAGTYRALSSTNFGAFSGATTFTGDVLNVGALNVDRGSTVDFSPAAGGPVTITLNSLSLFQAGLRGTDNFVVTGLTSLDYSGLSGPGSTFEAQGGLDIADSLGLDHLNLISDAATFWNVNAPSGIFTLGPVTFTNFGTFTVQGNHTSGGGDSEYFGPGDGQPLPTFDNRGSIVKVSPSNAVDFVAHFLNTGSIAVQGGILFLGDPAGDGTSSGPITAAAGTNLTLQGLTTTGPVSGDTITLANDTITGTYQAASSTTIGVYGGTVFFTGPVLAVGGLTIQTTADFSPVSGGPATLTIPSLVLLGGTLSGTDNFIVTAPFTWNGGTISGHNGQGSFTVQRGMTISGGGTAVDLAIINPATTTCTGSTIYFYGADSSFTNTATGTFDDQVDGTFGNVDGNCAPFNNQGLFLKSGGTGTTNLQMELFNTGTVTVQTGTLNLGCGYVQAPPSGGGGSSGTISGNITGAVSNPGQLTVAPAPTPPPTLTTYSQTVTGVLNEEIGGYAVGTQYGQIVVTTAVNLAGTLNVLLINGFTPKVGDTFTIIQNLDGNPINGTFAGLPEGGTVLGGGYLFQISYVGGTGHDVTLTAIKIGSAATLTSSAIPALLNQGVTLTATISPAVAGAPTPTGSVDFFDTTTNTDFGTVSLSGGTATLTTSSLAVGNHVIQASYSGDTIFLASAGSVTQSVHYNFSGFLAPLNKSMPTGSLGKQIPIKFQLKDVNGNPVPFATVAAALSAVASLQVQLVDSSGNPLAAPFTPASNSGLTYDPVAQLFTFNWSTKGLSAGYYQIQLALNDGTIQTKIIQLTPPGKSAGLTTSAAGGTGSTGTNALLAGDIVLYVDNTNGDLTADELARIQDAVTAADAVTEPYGVAVQEVTDPTLADVTLNMDTTSAVGGYADGVLGCTTDAGQITLITGWNFYAGSDATQIGSGQYDFETVVTHELGHALGLGHSSDSTSVMYATLNAGTVNRSLTTADLNVPDSDTTGACGLHAALTVGRISNPSYEDGRDLVFAMLAGDLARGSADMLASFVARDSNFTNGLASRAAGRGATFSAASFDPKTSDPIFATPLPPESEDPLFDVPLFPDPSHGTKSDANQPDASIVPLTDQSTDYMPADLAILA